MMEVIASPCWMRLSLIGMHLQQGAVDPPLVLLVAVMLVVVVVIRLIPTPGHPHVARV